MQPIYLSNIEVMQLEDTLRQVELPSGDERQPYMLTAEEWSSVCLRVGAMLGLDGDVVFEERDMWAIIRLLSVFARVGQEQVGLSIKTKLYTALAAEQLSFLDSIPNAEEVTYASQSPAESETRHYTSDDTSASFFS